ncbi:MAG: tRNA 2-thiouridine(34) synthase MnmA [Alphaproteobacteria bacterium]|nr:tRNA 2-thiouridine(34) synthase MnmA [Alphaproteobacteria bacterium]
MNSLGIDKRPGDTRVVVAMSGGVDSAVTAALLAEQGYDVVGVTLQLYDQGAAAPARARSCCAGQDIHDARRAAGKIGIPHYVLDYESRFKQSVIDDFVDTYLAGATPVPCVRCNQTVKFRDLLATARELGAEALATGHYVRRVAGERGPELHRAADPVRDQSYFLFATTRAQLDFLRFPLGDMRKDETRALARRFALDLAEKPDSQDICFVPDGNYQRVIERLRPAAVEPGDIVHVDGTVLGRHAGVAHFTVGQRRGLAIDRKPRGQGDPLFVVAIDAAARRVVVGPRAALARERVVVGEVNWLADPPAAGAALRVAVKLRSTSALQPAAVVATADGMGAVVTLDHPAEAVAPGQACVLYAGERVLGGGWIRRAEAAPATASDPPVSSQAAEWPSRRPGSGGRFA